MIFVFIEDGTLEVVASLQEARRNYEGIDVESGIFQFFDEYGIYLEPRFTKPNRTGRFLGIFSWVESGEYELVPNPDAEEDSILEKLSEQILLAPNVWFRNLEEVKSYLKSRSTRRVELDYL